MDLKIQTKIIPRPGSVPNVERDAAEAFRVMKEGGLVVVPTDVGYGMLSNSSEGLDRAFSAKQRRPGHTLGIIGSYEQHEELHVLSDSPEERARLLEMTRALTVELGGPLAFVSRYDPDNHRLKQLSAQTLDRLTKGGTIVVAVPDGPFLAELARLNFEDGRLMMGSSANMTGQGQKYRVEDIESEILEAADLIVDYGLQKWHVYERSGTILDIDNMKPVRIGVGYEVIRERLRKWWGVELREDPTWKTDGVKRLGISIKEKEYE